jgi:hypothetical protein
VAHSNFRFLLPDPMNPRVVRRDLKLLLGDRKAAPVELKEVALIELIRGRLYEVPEDAHPEQSKYLELKRGRILSRNWKVSKKFNDGKSPVLDAQQCFTTFADAFRARRGTGRVDRVGRARKIPALVDWRDGLQKLTRSSWKLRRVDVDGQGAYVLQAVSLMHGHAGVRDEDKVSALARTAQAGDPLDSLGRFNKGRIPLQCHGASNSLHRRTQAVRGIGWNMNFRETVLEAYLDALQTFCREVSFSQEYRLQDHWLVHDSGRTAGTVRIEARRLLEESVDLRKITTLPFGWALSRSADDLGRASELLFEAANSLDPSKIVDAKAFISRVYRSMQLLECRWRLEELLLQVSVMQDKQLELGASTQRMWIEELGFILGKLSRRDPLTKKGLDHGFRGLRMARMRVSYVVAARAAVARELSEGGPDMDGFHAQLKLACDPLRKTK